MRTKSNFVASPGTTTGNNIVSHESCDTLLTNLQGRNVNHGSTLNLIWVRYALDLKSAGLKPILTYMYVGNSDARDS